MLSGFCEELSFFIYSDILKYRLQGHVLGPWVMCGPTVGNVHNVETVTAVGKLVHTHLIIPNRNFRNCSAASTMKISANIRPQCCFSLGQS